MILLTFMSCYLQILRLYLRRNISDIARITLVINATVYIYVIECNTVRYEIHDNISLLFLLILLFFISFFFLSLNIACYLRTNLVYHAKCSILFWNGCAHFGGDSYWSLFFDRLRFWFIFQPSGNSIVT
jgi:hypothetical protein